MAKDVDLSSKEWRDIVFEGKNKEYGAYELRKNSDSRHNKAVLVILLFVAAVFIISLVITNFVASEAKPEDETDQQMVEMTETKEEEPEQEDVKEKYVEPVVEQATVAVTEIAIKEDASVKPENQIMAKEKDDNKLAEIGKTTIDSDKLFLDDPSLRDKMNAAKESKTIDEGDKKQPEPAKKEDKKEVNTNKVFDHVEQMPVYPGGQAALLADLAKNAKYPEAAKERQAKGRVMVRFIVTETGAISNPQVIKSVDPDLDRAALQAVKGLKKFTPGKQNGNAVKVYFTAPITFKLQE